MTVRELIEALQRQAADPQRLDWEVLVWAPDDTDGEVCLCPIKEVDYDKLWPSEDAPFVVCVDLDRSYATTERVSEWLDAERPDWRE